MQTGDQVDYFIGYSIQRRKHALKAVSANMCEQLYINFYTEILQSQRMGEGVDVP